MFYIRTFIIITLISMNQHHHIQNVKTLRNINVQTVLKVQKITRSTNNGARTCLVLTVQLVKMVIAEKLTCCLSLQVRLGAEQLHP